MASRIPTHPDPLPHWWRRGISELLGSSEAATAPLTAGP